MNELEKLAQFLRMRRVAMAKPGEFAQTKEGMAEIEAIGATEIAEFIQPGSTRVVDPSTDEDAVLLCTDLNPVEGLIKPDNKTALCAYGCGTTIQFRPYHPDNMVKVCIPCGLDRVEQETN